MLCQYNSSSFALDMYNLEESMYTFILYIYILCYVAVFVEVAIVSLVIELYLKDSVLEFEKVKTEQV